MPLKSYIKKWRNIYVINHAKRAKLPDFKSTPTIRKRLVFSGRVQNVGFRLEVSVLAKRLELVGWVKNKEDKTVEAEVQGESAKIDFLMKHMKSLKRAAVQDITMESLPMIENVSDFLLIKGK